MYIYSTHIKIVKLIQNHDGITLNDISNAILLNDFTTRIYLKELKNYTQYKNLKPSMQEIFKDIANNKKLIYTLKKNQHFTKQEKIDFIVFNLLTKDFCNLSKISEVINVNKRGLNYYFAEIEEILSQYKIVIKRSKQGISLKGTSYNKAKLLFIFIFKLYIDFNFLPHALKKEFLIYIHKSGLKKNKNYKNIYPKLPERYKEISPFSCRYTFKYFSSLYLSHKELSGKNSIKNLREEDLLKYKPQSLTIDKYFLIMDLIKITPLGELKSSNIDLLFHALEDITYSFKKFSKLTINKAQEIKPIIEKYMKNTNYNNYDYINNICPWINFAFFRKKFNIFDFNYQISNINIQNTPEVNNYINEINKIVPLFTKLDLLMFSYTVHSKYIPSGTKNKILVYDKLSGNIINFIINKLQTIHNIKIDEAINIKVFNKNLQLDNKFYTIVTIENLKIRTNCEVKNYTIPHISS